MEIVLNGEDMTAEVEFEPGWFMKGSRAGHIDNWTSDEGERAEIDSIKVEDLGDVTQLLPKAELERIQRECDDFAVEDYLPEYDDFDPFEDS